MTRSSSKAQPTRRIAAFCLLVISILLLVSSFQPWAAAQAGWRIEIQEGQKASSSLEIGNHCRKPHRFSITNKFKGLKFSEATDSLLIDASGTKRIAALFDATGLKSKVYRGKVDVECIDCKEEKGCSQDRDELGVEMNVIKSMTTSKFTENASATAAGNYTLNKYIYPGTTTFTSLNPLNPAGGTSQISTWSIGVPILYVLTLQDSSTSTTLTTVNLKDDLGANNPHFHVLNVGCTPFTPLASCGTLPVITNTTIPPLTFSPQLGGGGTIVIQILGYYDAAGTFSNTASVLDQAQTVLTSQTKTVTIQSGWSSIDLGIKKTSSTSDTAVPATIHYTVTLTGDNATDFYPGSLQIQDTLRSGTSPQPSYVISGFNCTKVFGSTCPGPPSAQSQSFSGGFSFTSFNMSWPTGPTTVIKKGDVITLTFDLKVSAAQCNNNIKVENWASIAMNGFNYADANTGNNTSTPLTSDSFVTGPGQCQVAQPIAGITKKRVCPLGGCPAVIPWGGTATYQITVTNNTSSVQTMQVSDWLSKASISAPMKVSLAPTGTATDVHCSPISANCTTTPSPPPNIVNDQQNYQLFQTKFTLAANGTVSLTFDVKIDKLTDCQTDPGNVLSNLADLFVISGNNQQNAAFIGETPKVDVGLVDLPFCQLKVTKTLDKPTNGVAWGQPVAYTITYENPDPTQPVTVNTLRDDLNMRDPGNPNVYGNVPIHALTVSCTAANGVAPLPSTINSVTQISASGPEWQGTTLIQEPTGGITFPPNSKLICTVSFIPEAPSATDNLCQGIGKPEIVNNAFLDVAGLQSSVQPLVFAQATAPLPLCRKVVVVKTPVDASGNAISSTGPGGLLNFQIKVINFSNDPVDNFVLTDQLPAGFIATNGPVTCLPTSACTGMGASAVMSGNQTLNAVFNQIPGTKLSPTNTVSLSFQVNAPVAGGTYKNTATGSFTSTTNSNGTQFYFEGDPSVLLVNSADVQVLTPVLAKTFNPQSVTFNGTASATFTITNMNSDPAQTGISFTDLLPTGVTVSSFPPTACGGAVSVSGGNAVTLSNAALGQGQHSCQFSVVVKASSCGALLNDRSNFSKVTNLDVTGAQATLTVTSCPDVKPPTLTKSFEPAKIGLNGSTTLGFTITNSGGDPQQSGIAFSDTLPPGLQIVGVSSNGCSGTVTISSDLQTVTLSGGQLNLGQHTCKILIKVKATDKCDTYRNNERNFSDVKNLDVSGIDEQLQVGDCPTAGLVVEKVVKGAPEGFKGQFNFLVQCATPKGFYQKAVTVDWPTPGFIALNDVPAGSHCTVTEGPPPGSLPANYNWSGLPAYSPQMGVITTGPDGGHVTVTDTMSPCNQTGQVTITKVVKGLPKDYIGVFQGTLQCWVSDQLVTYPVTLSSPNGLSTTIGNIPLGSACTFQETGQPPLSGDLVWNQPIYSADFGAVTLSGECCQQITVTNEARHCCTQTGSGSPTTDQPSLDRSVLAPAHPARLIGPTSTRRKGTRVLKPGGR